ncbi:methionine synthase (B12-independent) [Pseudopedobacter saltans DSM 12145]|uniref:5-methyltetrahydropteroyltriglutamate--homocysteine methyltransferase n=1 Tax=Pseudopedobacter saltans (strain ATCC 51119 / DSM 12145 / JCM 21818 / CCUG 39354 / LMG 10337 / NBRC 100064 / NCIMB 13643) TaxID=762903 RepID=F0SAW6_PSESL|nr:5-methyltetrahydropteroyltriglutamate--homocysteine S-methyltransferase [Pseudopedobacter saltans]ADY51561.1 methionine synthase (B12-independent) [Pseudopedobacter saltans DSM 12145]
MQKNNLGYPRIGVKRELKKANEQYWSGKISRQELFQVANKIKEQNWLKQKEAGIDLIPCNDFSFYDQVLDMSMALGNIPSRYNGVVIENRENTELDLYFAMARGYQKDGLDIKAMEMTKWFDTNYHYIVPEFYKNQKFRLFSNKIINDFTEAKRILDKTPKTVIIGPVTYLLLGKEKEEGLNRLDYLKDILPIYTDMLAQLTALGAEWIQFDEPFLALDLTEKEQQAYTEAYSYLRQSAKGLKFLLTTYFDALEENTTVATSLPVDAIHIDLVRAPQQLGVVLAALQDNQSLSLGVIDGRNIWKNDYQQSLDLINKAIGKIGKDRILIAPSSSLLHVPIDLSQETDIDPEIRNWMAYAEEKLEEITELAEIAEGNTSLLTKNQDTINSKRISEKIHKPVVKQRTAGITENDAQRNSKFAVRQQLQQESFHLPLFPTTTIGSFPQTDEIRKLRADFKKGNITQEQYDLEIEKETIDAIKWQEETGIDVLVHGEFERNDMVEYFGERLDGFLFSKNGWVQSYGSRCVKPPVIYGDVSRPTDMTVKWTAFAQQQTQKLMKGMLTGPVTILQWSFVRNDQSRSETTNQIALAIRDEVVSLEKAGIKIIQIDEPAIREGLPLRKKDWEVYLNWAIKAFRISASGVQDETQIHTHMCYSEFNDIIEHIAAMDADVITIETSRSDMELLSAFSDFKYPNEIGPGVYDIHSPRIPTIEEMVTLLEKAVALLPVKNIWINPDCGLKTRKWPETKLALENMVKAGQKLRAKIEESSLA